MFLTRVLTEQVILYSIIYRHAYKYYYIHVCSYVFDIIYY